MQRRSFLQLGGAAAAGLLAATLVRSRRSAAAALPPGSVLLAETRGGQAKLYGQRDSTGLLSGATLLNPHQQMLRMGFVRTDAPYAFHADTAPRPPATDQYGLKFFPLPYGTTRVSLDPAPRRPSPFR